MGIINAGTAVGAVVAPAGDRRHPRRRELAVGVRRHRAGRAALDDLVDAGRTSRRRGTRDCRRPNARRSPRCSSSRRATNRKRPGAACCRIAQVWGLVVAKFLSDAAWYFYLFWLPKYLYDVRGFDVKQVGAYAWIPYAAAGVGCLVGGWFSGWLLQPRLVAERARARSRSAPAPR